MQLWRRIAHEIGAESAVEILVLLSRVGVGCGGSATAVFVYCIEIRVFGRCIALASNPALFGVSILVSADVESVTHPIDTSVAVVTACVLARSVRSVPITECHGAGVIADVGMAIGARFGACRADVYVL